MTVVTDLMQKMFLVNDNERGYVVFVRHGESERQSNSGSEPDSFDTPLSDRGRKQAGAVAERLKDRTIDVLYSSPLKRAEETASIVAEKANMDVTVREDLREVEIDRERALAAMNDEEFVAHLEESNGSIQDFRWSSLGFTESSESLRTRVTSAVDSIVADHPGKTVVVFSHTGVINAYLTSCIGLDSDFLTLPAHTGVSTVRTRGDQRVVVTVNDYSHLR